MQHFQTRRTSAKNTCYIGSFLRTDYKRRDMAKAFPTFSIPRYFATMQGHRPTMSRLPSNHDSYSRCSILSADSCQVCANRCRRIRRDKLRTADCQTSRPRQLGVESQSFPYPSVQQLWTHQSSPLSRCRPIHSPQRPSQSVRPRKAAPS